MGGYVHLAVSGLFLSGDAAAEGCAGLELHALEALLARAEAERLRADSLESWLCQTFGAADGAVAPVTLLADGERPGSAYWLRADPVHLMLRGSEIILRPAAALTADEAGRLCETLNRHFAGDGLNFLAPQPARWYLRMDRAPGIETFPLAQAAGRDIRSYMPHGPDALAWHRLLNEIQMLLHAHPVNDARETRGELPVNSVWLWGGGYGPGSIRPPYSIVYADSPLAAAFAGAAGIGEHGLAGGASAAVAAEGRPLIVWDGLSQAAQRGDIDAWRDSLGALERDFVGPLLRALRSRKLERLTLDALQEGGSWRFTLTPRSAWRFWRRSRRLGQYPAAAG
jgi:hypothetical protein